MDGIILARLYRKVLFYLLMFCALLGGFKIIAFIKAFFKKSSLKNTSKKGKYAIVIPARNESKVIEGLLKSIRKQNYDQSLIDIYVTVREEDDPTIEISKRYDCATMCVKANSKGEVLDYTFKNIISGNKEYDAIFVMDADNVIKNNFIVEMNKAYQEGYPIAVAYRNNKEWNNGVVSACSALTLFMINTFQNKPNNDKNLNMVVSGTGYYISYDLIKNFGGWPFNTLTEDYELSMYSTLNNIKIKYVASAEFLDEQPTSFKVSYIQRLRWVKGYLQVHKKYKNELNELDSNESGFVEKLKTKIGIWPFVLAIVAIVIYALLLMGTSFVGFFMGLANRKVLIYALFELIFTIYCVMVGFSLILFLLEIKRIDIKFGNLIKACLFNPIFLASFVPLIIKALKVDEVEWTPIAHTINKNDEED